MRLFAVMVLLVALCACRTMQPVDYGNWQLAGQVEAGDRVQATTTDGRTLDFVVTEVTGDALVGKNVRVPREEIAQLRVEAVSKGRTFGATFGGAALWILMLIGASSAAILSGG